MTHDELLTKLSQDWNGTPHLFSALSAVVELHKPYTMDSDSGEVLGCSCIPELPAFLNPYPCATIQAIEKELV